MDIWIRQELDKSAIEAMAIDWRTVLTEYRRHVTFVDKDGDEHTFAVADGDNLLDIAQANDLEMEGAPQPSSTTHNFLSDKLHRCLRRFLCLLNLPRNSYRRGLL